MGELYDIFAELAREGIRRISLNLAELSFMDSTGLSLLVAIYQRACASGGELVIFSPTRPVRRLFAVAGLDAFLTIRPMMVPEQSGPPEKTGPMPVRHHEFPRAGRRIRVSPELYTTVCRPSRASRPIWAGQILRGDMMPAPSLSHAMSLMILNFEELSGVVALYLTSARPSQSRSGHFITRSFMVPESVVAVIRSLVLQHVDALAAIDVGEQQLSQEGRREQEN